MTNVGSWMAMEEVQGTGPKSEQVQEGSGSASGMSGGEEGKTGIKGVDNVKDVSGVGVVDAEGDIE